MKTYKVEVSQTTHVSIIVEIEAENKTIAEETAGNKLMDGDYSDLLTEKESKGAFGVEFRAEVIN